MGIKDKIAGLFGSEEKGKEEEEKQTEKKEEETYNMDFICMNCGDETSMELPKNLLAREWMIDNEKRKCENCGCSTLMPNPHLIRFNWRLN